MYFLTVKNRYSFYSSIFIYRNIFTGLRSEIRFLLRTDVLIKFPAVSYLSIFPSSSVVAHPISGFFFFFFSNTYYLSKLVNLDTVR